MSDSLLDQIVEAAAPVAASPAAGEAKTPTGSRVVRTDAGIEYLVDPVTGIGTRLTPFAGRRSMHSKPPVTTRQFAVVFDRAAAVRALAERYKLTVTELAELLTAYSDLAGRR